MVEFGRVQGKVRIRASTEKLSKRVSEKRRISVSIEKWKNPGEYLENIESVRVLKNCIDKYWQRVESM